MSDLPEFCDLVNAAACSRGVVQNPLTEKGRGLLEEIGKPDILVFVLIDGLGKHLLQRLPEGSFLRSIHRGDLLSVFPSTTACAMTSLATGLPPAVHGIPGRYAYLKERDLHVDTLSFRTRAGKKLLSPETAIGDLWPYPSLLPQLGDRAFSLVPEVLRHSPFERVLSGSTETEGYQDIPSAVRVLTEKIPAALPGSLLFGYIWELDSLCHKVGTERREVDNLLAVLNTALETLALAVHPRGRLVITADHGQFTVDKGQEYRFSDTHPLMATLKTPPFGEPRALQFLVKEESEEKFITEFTRAFGEAFRLYSREEAEKEGFFGAPAFSAYTKQRFGDYLAVAVDRALLLFEGRVFKAASHQGEHGGMLPEERIIPLLMSGN